MQKKIPMRQCCGCREKKPKRELLRIVRSPEGEISFDDSGKKSGRGVYICRSEECLGHAVKSGAIRRALGAEPDASLYALLRERLETAGAGDSDG